MARRRSTFVAGLLAVAVATASLPGLAEPTAAEKETARTLMKEGRARREKGDHKGALEAFAAADAIMHVPTTGYELGKEQLEQGLLVEARDTFLRVSRIPEEKGEPAPFSEARKQAKQFAADIEPRVPSLKVVLTGPASAQATVTVDGTSLPKATVGLPQRLNPGVHEIVATSGGVTRKISIELKESETKEAKVDLTPSGQETAAPKPPEPKPQQPTEPAKTEKPQQPKPTMEPGPTAGRGSTLTWIGFGVAGAGVIAGSVTGLLAASSTSKAKDLCDGNRCPPAAHDDLASARSMATISTVSFIVAGVGVGVGVYGLVSRGGGATSNTTGLGPLRSVTASIGPGSIGLSGRF